MSIEFRPQTAEQAWQARAADRKLQVLTATAHLAEGWERETSERVCQAYVSLHRKLVGVHPAQREEFRAALNRICDGGGMLVEDLIDTLRRKWIDLYGG